LRIHRFARPEDLGVLHAGSVATVGVFDGLHLGHQAILDRLRDAAARRALPAVCLTFSRHPRSVLRGEAPRQILSLEHRLELLARQGVDDALVIDFGPDFAALTAEDFVEELLVRRLGCRELVIGHDTAVGRDRRGDAEWLGAAGQRYGFRVVAVGGVSVNGETVSSTAVRAAIAQGDLRHAERLLGRPVSVLGTVVHGQGRGGSLGFPTANLEVRSEAFPPLGVYAVRVLTADGPLPAVMNYGLRPTFQQDTRHAVFEIHVLDRSDLHLYGQNLEVELVEFLRREQRFESVAELVAQIARDCEAARAVFAEAPSGG